MRNRNDFLFRAAVFVLGAGIVTTCAFGAGVDLPCDDIVMTDYLPGKHAVQSTCVTVHDLESMSTMKITHTIMVWPQSPGRCPTCLRMPEFEAKWEYGFDVDEDYTTPWVEKSSTVGAQFVQPDWNEYEKAWVTPMEQNQPSQESPTLATCYSRSHNINTCMQCVRDMAFTSQWDETTADNARNECRGACSDITGCRSGGSVPTCGMRPWAIEPTCPPYGCENANWPAVCQTLSPWLQQDCYEACPGSEPCLNPPTCWDCLLHPEQCDTCFTTCLPGCPGFPVCNEPCSPENCDPMCPNSPNCDW